MFNANAPGGAPNVTTALAADRLGVPAVTYFAISMCAPFTVVAGAITTGYAVTGQIGIPIGFLAMGVVLAVFCVGFVTMAPYVPNAGAFNAYIAKGLGRPAGVAAGWLALVSYNAMQVGVYGAFGDAAQPLIKSWFGVEIAWWAIALGAWALVAFLGTQHIDLNGKVLAVLMVAECLVILVYAVSFLLNPAGNAVSLQTLDPSHLFEPGAGALFSLAILGFVGFETAVVFSEEAKVSGRTVPVATYLSLGVTTLLYVLGSWAISVATGPGRVAEMARANGSELVFRLAHDQLGVAMVGIGRFLYATSVFAALIAFHNAAARYAFAMGRERVLPSFFGQTSSRNSSPRGGSILQSAIGLVGIIAFAIAGVHPLRDVFFIWTSAGSLGILLLIVLTAFAIVAFFAKTLTPESAWKRTVAPVLAAASTLVAFVLVLANFDKTLDVPSDSPLRWAIPGGYLVLLLLGLLWGFRLRARRPRVYTNIGLGAKSVTRTGLGLGSPEEQADTTKFAPINRY
ncbi:APC family permease [Allokutzneria albata]|uniref:Amino acid transporter n=1 Tax=Allokutzneria albata TaxID=211114 RepID=A0A1G9WMR5_ALLAB|nr:APC family permease [Allokutzneria albata]SDM85804.1 Amino acid transporter [Allokutzneria albata]